MLLRYEHFIETVKMKLIEDHRIIGLLGGGSMITGAMDEYSDLDLIVVYHPDYRDEIMQQRIHMAESLGTVLSVLTGEHVGEPKLVICLYDGSVPLHVDYKFLMPKELEERIEDPVILWERGTEIRGILRSTVPCYPHPDPQWIEDRFWIWIHSGAAKLGRGELFEVIDILCCIRSAVLGPLILAENGRLPNGTRRIEQLAVGAVEELKQTVPSYHLESCYQALQSSILLYRRLRLSSDRLVHQTKAEQVAVAYLDNVYASADSTKMED
ncbi:oxalate:formate antiporter [Paenibacillus elgii]|uniref:oxalate:formate antiporter n=1 Tax=Paenibacillus elgii TaxID=189691 RepID=UPI000FD6CDBD|nr:oxalate:formate antiporter [Paenibacillus elgii]NEN84818.1 oxalate:formate antiporter [Paenibacillus elgii]